MSKNFCYDYKIWGCIIREGITCFVLNKNSDESNIIKLNITISKNSFVNCRHDDIILKQLADN